MARTWRAQPGKEGRSCPTWHACGVCLSWPSHKAWAVLGLGSGARVLARLGTLKKKKEDDTSDNANLVENQYEEIVAMVSEMQIGMITKLNIAIAIKSFDWWLDSGATIHVCNDKSLFYAYEEENDGEVVLMGNHVSAKVLRKGVSIFNLPLERN
ncbi:hypothetical protein LWI28_022797 [Acer negundo]|uniref:Retrovirus-related Pol polyprotein from transposon TNT 1-94-like beta-barrel domain-containing protein n=1 Tax=Acer negundo TaxID=4023 RepID=A0AAD5IBB6_ACENE|nr:hypothetical protein LWI28_022797 [Acer negundo]